MEGCLRKLIVSREQNMYGKTQSDNNVGTNWNEKYNEQEDEREWGTKKEKPNRICYSKTYEVFIECSSIQLYV